MFFFRDVNTPVPERIPPNEIRSRARRLVNDNEPELAWALVESVLPSKDPAMIALAGEILLRKGMAPDAAVLIDRAAPFTDARPALVRAQAAMMMDDPAHAAAVLEPIARARLGARARRSVLFQLGDAYDALGRYDDAFGAYRLANETSKPMYDPMIDSAAVTEVIRSWTPHAVERARREPEDETPVFIVGMPRSGTTLIERLIGAHPEVHAGGESTLLQELGAELGVRRGRGALARAVNHLPGDECDAIADAYLDSVRAHGTHRVTDKHPLNFFHLGLIASALPGARVIHCVRDPRDTCLSCYFRMFDDRYIWASDLAWIKAFHDDYRRLMDHWQSVLPAAGLRITTARYEDAVADPDSERRRLLDFLGLDADDAPDGLDSSASVTRTLRFDQVNAGVYASSVGKWKRYEKHIEALLLR